MENSLSKGVLLIAEPFMLDPNFKRSVIFLTDYDPVEGSFGFILNRRVDMKITDLITDFPEINARVNYGGPVGSDTIHYLHSKGDILDDSIKIMDGVYWGGDFEKLKFLIENKLIIADEIVFFIGYSGWSAGQLEDELELRSWVIQEGDMNYVYKTEQSELWKESMYNLGDTYTVISSLPDQQNLN